MKAYMKKFLSMILVIAIACTGTLTGFAETAGGKQKSAGDVFSFEKGVTWAEAGKQIASMLSYIVEDAANIDLAVHSARIANLSLEDDSIYLAILAENGYLPEEPAQIDPDASISTDEYVRLMESAFPTVVDSQEAIDVLRDEAAPGNFAVMGDGLSMDTMLPERIAVTTAQQLSLTAVKAPALSLNAESSVTLSESEIARVHIHDTAVEEEAQPGEKTEPDVIYLHMDSGTQLPEIIVKSADEVLIEGSGALGVVRVQEAPGSLTVRATGSVVNETDAAFEVTGPDTQIVELQPGEQVDFVLSKWLVSFVTEGSPVETQEVVPGGMVNFAQANTTLEGKVFTAWYEDATYTQPFSRLSSVNKQTTLYARFVNESDAAIVTFETFGGRELEPLVFARGESLLTKPVESLYTSKEGYSFGGWCVDEECTTAFGYTDPIEESMTLYAMYSSYEQEVREDPGTVAEIELPDGMAGIGLVLPEGMTAAEAKDSITVESGTGAVVPEIAVRETEGGMELYCEAGFIPGTSFTLYAQNGVQFAGYPEYIDTLAVSIFREQVEIVEFTEGLTYVLWDEVTEYTPVSETDLEYSVEYAEDGTEYNMLEDHDAEGRVVPGKLVMTGEADFQPEQIVVFYDGEINDDEIPADAWEGGDLAGHVLFAEIESVKVNEDGNSEVTFGYANPEDYITALDVHTTEQVNIEELLDEEQIEQVEKAISSQLASNDELKAQMLVAVMTSEDTQRILDDKYGPGTYSLAGVTPVITDPKLDIDVSVKDSTATAAIGVGLTVSLYGPEGLMVRLTPYMFFEQQLALDVNMDGGFLWLGMSVVFKTKSTVRLELKATTGGEINVLDEAKSTLEEILNADGTATEGYNYQEAANTLMNTMQELAAAELNYQDLFAVKLLKIKKSFKGIITFGINVELKGQAAVIATFGVEVMAEYGQKVGFNYNFLKAKGGSYKQKLASEVTTNVYLIGKLGARLGITITFYIKLLQSVTVSTSGGIYAYVELAGMFMYTYALSAGGDNYVGALYLEVGVDIEILLTLSVKINMGLFTINYGKNWVLWNHRWKLYSMSRGMTMGVVQNKELDEMWAAAMVDADHKTSYPFLYLPMKTYDMLDGSCTDNQLLFENMQDGNVTTKLSLENVFINGEAVEPGDPRIDVLIIGDGANGRRPGVIYADEIAAAAYKVESYECEVVLTYENRNKSELIKKHQQFFPFAREFKMATTTVNVNVALYDWCAHSWGIEEAAWDNDVVFETSFEDTHVLGCPVEPSATGFIDLDAVIARVKELYPEIDGAALSWFNPTLNPVNRTVQYSVPRISNLCYMTPGSETVRYDVFETTNEYDLTFYLYASRYPGYTGQITYIIEGPEAPADAVFTVSGSAAAEAMTFEPVEGDAGQWTLTASRAAFDGKEHPVMMQLDGEAVPSGLTVTGREAVDVVVLTLGELTGKLSVSIAEGIESWGIRAFELSELDAVAPGETIALFANLKDGYESLRLTSEPKGLKYTSDGDKVSFTMPSHDINVTLYGVRHYQANYMYNYGDLGAYHSVDVVAGSRIAKPADPSVTGLTFAGWYDNASCEGEPFDFGQKLNSNITLYADWRVNVTVDFGGPKGQAAYISDYRYEEIDGENVEIIDSGLIFPGDESEYARFTYATKRLGDVALEIILPNYDGYDFFGWYLTPDYSGDPVDPVEYELTGGVTFYARWERIAMLTYELNYGEQEESYAVSMEYAGMPLGYIPEDPQREYYQFLGWYRTPDGNETEQVILAEYIAEGAMTLYAHWLPVEYTITYELNGGENDPNNPGSYNVESGDVIFNEPTREGYYFVLWEMTGIENATNDGFIPEGSVGDVVMTAIWEPVTYIISYDIVRGETEQPNPAEYTIESADIVLSNPSAEKYEFTGWTGTDLAEPNLEVIIPAGSTGDRSFKANWITTDPIGRIIETALAAIPDEYAEDISSFTGIQDIEAAVLNAVAEDETCSGYLDQLSVSVAQSGDVVEDGASYTYNVQVTVSFTDDSGSVTSDSKNVVLTVMKNPVIITASVSYPEGLLYIPYGTTLADVALGDCTATAGGEPIDGIFAWVDSTIVPLGADNGMEMYKVVFTPTDTASYSTAETLIAVNAQIGLQIVIDALDTEYMGRALDAFECSYYAIDIDTGEKIDDVTLSITGAVIEQSQIKPGTNVTVKLTGFDACEIQSNTDNALYALVGTETGDTITITRATPTLSGAQEYTAEYGSVLRNIELDLKAGTATGILDVAGTFEWAEPAAMLDTIGSAVYTVIFTPDELECYNTATIEVTVSVGKKPVEVPRIESVLYDGTHKIAEVPESELYSPIYNEGGTDAGDYTVILSLADPENYCWADSGTSADKRLTFAILPRELSVSGTASVMKLAYGQMLNPDVNDESTDVWKTAHDMISGLTVTDALTGEPVTGKWVWDDPDNVSQALRASAKGDDEDFGDGYSVEAYFLPTSEKQSNYTELRQNFTVEVARAVPDVSNSEGYVPYGAIYQPESGTAVNQLKDYDPAFRNNPVNPVNSQITISGYVSWEDSERYPEATGYYNAVFEPLKENYGDMVGHNYTSVLMPIYVEIKHNVDIEISIDGGDALLYSGPTPTSNLVSTRTITQIPGNSIRFALSHNKDGVPMVIDSIEYIYRINGSWWGFVHSYNLWDYSNEYEQSGYGTQIFSLNTVQLVKGSYGVFEIVPAGDATSPQNRSDVRIVITMKEAEESPAAESVMLMSMAAPPMEDPGILPTDELITDPTVEPTEEPIVEPTEEPIVEPTEEPIVEPTEEPVVEPTEEPIVEPTEEPIVEPTEEPIVDLTEEPVIEPTMEPSVESIEESDAEPAAESTAESTEKPIEEPAADATLESTPMPIPEPTPVSTSMPALEPAPEPVQEVSVAEEAAGGIPEKSAI